MVVEEQEIAENWQKLATTLHLKFLTNKEVLKNI